MRKQTLNKFREVARLEGGRRFVDPDDLLQDVLVDMYAKGKDPEDNQGLVITRLKWVAIDKATAKFARPEIVTDYADGWESSVEPAEHKRPGRTYIVSAIAAEITNTGIVDFVKEYIGDLLREKLDGLELGIAMDYYLDGKRYNDIQKSNSQVGVYLTRARRRLTDEDVQDLSAWDDFNRGVGGRRRIALAGAPRLRQVLIKADLV